MSAFGQYPYLIASLSLLALMGIAWLNAGRHRGPVILSGLLSAPWALTSPVLVPVYWRPKLLLPLCPGIEDILFQFSCGGLIWWLACHFYSDCLHIRIRVKQIVIVYLSFCACYIVCVIALLWAGFNTMGAFIAASGPILIVMAIVRPAFAKTSLLVGVTFGFGYTVLLRLAFELWPHLQFQWNEVGLSGLSLLGVPVEETAWAFGYGMVWSMLMANLLDDSVPQRVVNILR